MRAGVRILFALLCCFYPASNGAQQAPPLHPPSDRPAPTAPGLEHRISLDVVVTDNSGNPVSGLQQPDFTILDDKQTQNILSFHATDNTNAASDPIQAIFLVDAVNAGTQSVSVERQQLEKFLREDNGKLAVPTSLVIFTDKSTQIQPAPTRDGKALVETLNSTSSGLRYIGRSQGFYGAAERLDLSLRTLERLTSYEATQPGRKLLIWISPGWPLLSGPGVTLTSKNQEALFSTIVSLSRQLREARMTLYAIDPLGMGDAGSMRTVFYENFLKGVRSSREIQYGSIGLQVLATQSGGRVLNSSNDIANLLASCLIDARAFYTLSFDYPPADHPDEYHNLEVKVDKPGLTVRTRTGYYAEPYKGAGR